MHSIPGTRQQEIPGRSGSRQRTKRMLSARNPSQPNSKAQAPPTLDDLLREFQDWAPE